MRIFSDQEQDDEQVTHYNSYCVILMQFSFKYPNTALRYVLLRQPPNTKTKFHNSIIILTQKSFIICKGFGRLLNFYIHEYGVILQKNKFI
jgi:hypothetical protein